MGGLGTVGNNNFIMYTTVGNLILKKKYELWRKVDLDSNLGPFSYKLCGFEHAIQTLNLNLLIL